MHKPFYKKCLNLILASCCWRCFAASQLITITTNSVSLIAIIAASGNLRINVNTFCINFPILLLHKIKLVGTSCSVRCILCEIITFLIFLGDFENISFCGIFVFGVVLLASWCFSHLFSRLQNRVYAAFWLGGYIIQYTVYMHSYRVYILQRCIRKAHTDRSDLKTTKKIKK